jgi:DeoR/GlpR family transcriptional regulator of sugar metabolism
MCFLLGVASLDDRGAYIASDVEGPTKRKMMEIAERVVVLADQAKFGSVAPVLLCPLRHINALITDATPPDALRAALAAQAIALTIATG